MIYEFLHHIRVKIMYEWILLAYNVRRTNKKKKSQPSYNEGIKNSISH